MLDTVDCSGVMSGNWSEVNSKGRKLARQTSLDLLTVGNMTFSGDTRYSILHQKYNNWVLVIKNVDMMDMGRYICTVQTFPEQSLSVFVRVHGEDGKLIIKHKVTNYNRIKTQKPSVNYFIIQPRCFSS